MGHENGWDACIGHVAMNNTEEVMREKQTFKGEYRELKRHKSFRWLFQHQWKRESHGSLLKGRHQKKKKKVDILAFVTLLAWIHVDNGKLWEEKWKLWE